jgi:phosphoribosylformylglycinamidine cyclo-ligase
MTSYQDAGVDLEGASRHVESIANLVTATWKGRVSGGFGGFATGIEIPPHYQTPVLMMSTDGVGTKLELARRSGIWDGVGQDLVAMCVDDLAAVGAEPVGFVDYMAVGSLQPDRDMAIVASIARACSQAGCALLGGETAEHPGVMEPDAVDLAGAVMGVVEKGQELGPHRVEPGNAVIGLASPNLRSNGFSLVRSVFGEAIDDHAEMLLEPSVIYSPAVSRAVVAGGVRAAAHITGGGLIENLARALPEGLGAAIDTSSWTPPPVFHMVAAKGVDDAEMFRTFNMGVGFCLVVDRDAVGEVMASVGNHDPRPIGEVIEGSRVMLN